MKEERFTTALFLHFMKGLVRWIRGVSEREGVDDVIIGIRQTLGRMAVLGISGGVTKKPFPAGDILRHSE